MVKARRTRRRIGNRRIRSRPYKLLSANQAAGKKRFAEKCPKVHEKRDWEESICSVCMECPHNAVLLLCSSHDKGCRPYMCGTSFRYSNCLDQYKKASAKLMSSNQEEPAGNSELTKLTCPLCRGQVKGWTIVQPVRDYLNTKTRNCVQENCSFSGSYKELRKHVKMEHPCAKPREVDPSMDEKWRRLELERARDDVISTIRSTMPGAMVLGDYVIDRDTYGSDSDEDEDIDHGHGHPAVGIGRNLVNVFLLLQAFGSSRNQTRWSDSAAFDDLASDENEFDRTASGGGDSD